MSLDFVIIDRKKNPWKATPMCPHCNAPCKRPLSPGTRCKSCGTARDPLTEIESFRLNLGGIRWLGRLLAPLLDERMQIKLPPWNTRKAEADPAYRQKWEKLADRVRWKRSARGNRIPACKFATSDGWIITPPECKLIAGYLRAMVPSIKSGLESGPKSQRRATCFSWAQGVGAAHIVGRGGGRAQHQELVEKVSWFFFPPNSWGSARDGDVNLELIEGFAAFNERAARQGGYRVL